MPRILLAQLKQETATFNPCPTTLDDFQIHRGQDVLSAYQGTTTEIAGALDVLSKKQWEVVPTVAASAVSGGRVNSETLQALLDGIVHAATQVERVDGLLIVLHGAMAGESENDPEGALLAALRAAFPNQPMVGSLDLHAVLTDRMLESANVLVPYHTYPHTDHYSTGQRAAECLVGLVEGRLNPVTARVRLPMLVRGDELLTATGEFGAAIRQCQQVEQSATGIAAGVLIGNAFTDVPALQSNVLVTTNNDRETAQREATAIAQFMWDRRKRFQASLTSLADSLRLAETTRGLVVFSDAADATASGAAGDSNIILKALMEAGFSKRALVPIVDAPAAQLAHQAGVGAEIEVSLGGTRDALRFSPMSTQGTVISLHDGDFLYEDGTRANAGRVAVLRVGQIFILITEKPVYVVGRQVFAVHGLNPAEFDLVVVKSPNGFRTWYEDISAMIVPVDAPGSTSANLHSLPFENCVRPIFPLDVDVEFDGGVTLH